MVTDPQPTLLWHALIAVAGLILLIARAKVHAFLALILAALYVGLVSGLHLPDIAKAFADGVGAILGSIAMVVGLGAVLGKLLEASGGATVVAQTILKAFGQKHLGLAMMVIGLTVGLPVFFGVGVVLLMPIALALARSSGVSLLSIALPMVAGLSVAHALIPPHPGALAAMDILKADPGRTILYAFLAGIPAALLAGPVFGGWIARRLPAPELNAENLEVNPQSDRSKPSFRVTLLTITLPILLMVLATVADLTLPKTSPTRAVVDFLGAPIVALAAAVILAFWTLGFMRGFSRDQLLKLSESSLGPTASILLVVGAGGGFNKVLLSSGVGTLFAHTAGQWAISPLILGWVLAGLIRVATGSATVAITAAAGFVAPLLAQSPTTSPELLVVSMGAGSVIFSHLNDGGFWFVKEYLRISVPDTLKSWTVLETIIAVVVLLMCLGLDALRRFY